MTPGPPRRPVAPRPGADRQDDRVVPVFALTRGRTRSRGADLALEGLVSATDQAAWSAELQKEYRVILDLARRPVSLVEIAALLDVPLGVARVLVGDLADSGHLVVHAVAPPGADGGPTLDLLNRLLEGLRARR